jgi:hypothetical protein
VKACVAKEVLGNTEVATTGSIQKACGGSGRERAGFVFEIVEQVRPRPLDRPHRYAYLASVSNPAPRSSRPARSSKLDVGLLEGLLRTTEPVAEPARNRHAHGISYELPAPSVPSATSLRDLYG